MSISQRTGKAGLLLILRKIWAGVLNLIIMAYLARILDKSDFGLIAIAGVFISFIEVLGSSSIIDYLIYRSDNDEEVLNSAFWLNFLIVVIIMVAIMLVAPAWARYYGNEKIANVVYILGISFVGYILSTIPIAILRKEVNYKHIILIQVVTGTASQITQLILAILGFGVYSLAIPSAIFPFVTGVYLFMIVRPKIKFSFGVRYWREMFSYLRYIIGSKILAQIENFGDNVIIGKTLGLTSLGVYNLSFRLSNIFNDHLATILSDITMPVFVVSNESIDKIKMQYIFLIRLTTVLFLPIFIGVILFADPIVLLLYGDKWTDAITPLRILTMLAAIRFFISPTSNLYYVLRKPRLPFYFMLGYIPLFVTLLWLFSANGLIWACCIVLGLGVLKGLFHFYSLSRIIKISIVKLLIETRHIMVPNMLILVVYTILMYFIGIQHVYYIMLLLYLPLVYLTVYITYRYDFYKDYLMFCKIFPQLRFFVSK